MTTLFGTILAEIPNPGNNPQISQFNATARVVRTAFSGHVVHLVPSAAPPGVECSALCDLAFDDLASGYTSAIRQLRTEISAEPPRLLPGSESRRMTGRDIADLLETVLPAANEGIERVGDRMADAIVRQHIADTKTRHAAAITNIEYPLETRELDAIVVRMEAAAMSEVFS